MDRIDLNALFGTSRPLIGMVHLPPLPGAPLTGPPLPALAEWAIAQAELLSAAGLDAIILENYGDAPFFKRRVPAATIAALAIVLADVVRNAALPVGINVLRNDARAAVALCATAGARFFRVNVHVGAMLTDQGWIEGEAARTMRMRRQLAPGAALLADVHVKHAAPPAGWKLDQAARDTWERGAADALIVSGSATGRRTETARLETVRNAVPDAPLLIGSGLTAGNAAELLRIADGAIVGSALQHDGIAGRGVDARRAGALVAAARAARD
jgi:hypothetical protein